MKRTNMTRREFLVASSAAAGGTVLAGFTSPAWAMRGMRGQMGGSAVIDPLPGEALRDPPELPLSTLQGGIRYGELEAREATVTFAGQQARLLTYNGMCPNPTIKVKRGDRLRLRLRNSLPRDLDRFDLHSNNPGHAASATNIHTHGWHVSPAGNSDNVHLVVQSGEEFLYEYDLSRQSAGTLSLYHPHIHGHVSTQMWRGLIGALQVEDEGDSLSGYESHFLILKDMDLNGNEPQIHTPHDFMHGKEGSLVAVNGQMNPVLAIRPGQVQRWRVLNASNARFYRLALEGHSLYLVGTDGGPLDKMYPQPSILLAPAERVDILIKAGSPGTYRFRALPYNRGMCGGTQTITLMTLACEGKAANDRGPVLINPDARRLTIPTAGLPVREFVLSMGHGLGYINGQTFDVNPYSFVSKVGGYELWRIVNSSCMDHPFHQHTNAAQVLDVQGGSPDGAFLYTKLPAWKDTVLVPAWGSVTLLVPVMDFSGDVMFHCHIIEHEDIGMMGMWYLRAEGEPPPTGGHQSH